MIFKIPTNFVLKSMNSIPTSQNKASECTNCIGEYRTMLNSKFPPELINDTEIAADLWAPLQQQVCPHVRPTNNYSGPQNMTRG